MNDQLQKKIEQSIKIIQLAVGDDVVEVAYSGGKDSDVILQLTRESGVKYRAIYKNTTIDPSGTIAHAKAMGAEVVSPRGGQTFFKLIEKKGLPSMMRRFCCQELKEYKILDKCIMGVRKAESTKRNKRYNEPTECRFYGSKKEHVEAIYPILDWSTQDVADFLKDRNIKCAPVYYDKQGNFHPERRLGCMCCPLASTKKRIKEFKDHPNMVKAYCRAADKFMKTHKDSKSVQLYNNVYQWFYRDLFFDSQVDFELSKNNLFGATDYKSFLEEFFGIKFNEDTYYKGE